VNVSNSVYSGEGAPGSPVVGLTGSAPTAWYWVTTGTSPAFQAGHAVLAAAGQWVTNEKTLLDRAGLRGVDAILAGLTPDPGALTRAVDESEALFASSLAS
jgi:hypothetical protein